MTTTKKQNFEEALTKLEGALAELKKEGLTLDAAIRNFEAGISHYKTCEKILNDTRQKIETYSKQEESV